jgi:uncharacterized membrane protein
VAVLVVPLLGAPGVSARATGCDPKVIDMGTLGGSTSEIIETNGRGLWVGSSRTAEGVNRAVLWDDGKIADLGVEGDAWASDVNNSGVIVGNGKESEDFTTGRAFIWRRGVATELSGLAPDSPTFVRRLNNRGDATGSAVDGEGTERAMVWQAGRAPMALAMPRGYLGAYGMAINDRGDVVGGAYKEDQLIAWGWDSDGGNHPLAELDRQGFSQANVLDNQGRAAGLSDFGGNPGAQAALWRDGDERNLGTFGDSDFSFALGTNHQGDFVGLGAYYLGDDRDHVFLTSASSTGPLRTLMPLSGDPNDGSGAHAVTGGNVTVGGHSDTATGEEHATVWTCAYQQAFVPNAKQAPTARLVSPSADNAIRHDPNWARAGLLGPQLISQHP